MTGKIKWGLFGAIVFAMFGLALFVVPAANAADTIVHVPTFPVSASFTWVGSRDSYSPTVLSGVGLGYDVKDNQPYTGWCVEETSTGDPGAFAGQSFTVTLYSSYDTSMPSNLTKWGARTIPWDQVNYALNHRSLYSDYDVARALFGIIQGVTPTGSANAILLYQDTIANGTGFVPSPGQVAAVILTNGSGINSSSDDGWQENIIPVTVPFNTAVTLSSLTAVNSNDNSMLMSLGVPGLALGLLGAGIGFGLNKRRIRRD
jgi:hypothetical protein